MGAIFRKGTNTAWGIFMMISVIAILGMNIYWLFTESGLILWLAEMQANIFSGNWFPKITFLLLTLAEIIALLIIKLLIEKIIGKPLTNDE
jgi:hypothetical protein